MILSALHSGACSALQAPNAVCTSEEELPKHLLKTIITQLNEADAGPIPVALKQQWRPAER
jgi:hypothetical protein